MNMNDFEVEFKALAEYKHKKYLGQDVGPALVEFVGPYIDVGGYRRVYEHRTDPSLVVKIEGLTPYSETSQCNSNEMKVWQQVKDIPSLAKWFAPVKWKSEHGWVLIQEKAPGTLNSEQNREQFMNSQNIDYIHDIDRERKLRRAIKWIPEFFMNKDLDSDTDVLRNWRLWHDGQPVCIDYGNLPWKGIPVDECVRMAEIEWIHNGWFKIRQEDTACKGNF